MRFVSQFLSNFLGVCDAIVSSSIVNDIHYVMLRIKMVFFLSPTVRVYCFLVYFRHWPIVLLNVRLPINQCRFYLFYRFHKTCARNDNVQQAHVRIGKIDNVSDIFSMRYQYLYCNTISLLQGCGCSNFPALTFR